MIFMSKDGMVFYGPILHFARVSEEEKNKMGNNSTNALHEKGSIQMGRARYLCLRWRYFM